jgi:predicted glycoside hydrolase/deacetylase ChbG (UPF0249 family)
MRQLIINADDLGFTPGVTRGIIEAHQRGIVTSTSALMNSPFIKESLSTTQRESPGLGIGVHLCLTEGKPLLPRKKVTSLVDEHGDFYRIHHESAYIQVLNFDQVYAEWQAQIETFISADVQPDHLDSHHHVSYSDMRLFEVMLALAQDYDLPIRFPPPQSITPLGKDNIQRALESFSIRAPLACFTDLYGESISLNNLLVVLAALPEGVSELMCHPGYADRALLEGSSYSTLREKELCLYTNPEARTALADYGVELASFLGLFG